MNLPVALRKMGLPPDACNSMVQVKVENTKLQKTVEALVGYLGEVMQQVTDIEKKMAKMGRASDTGSAAAKGLPEKLAKMEEKLEAQQVDIDEIKSKLSTQDESLGDLDKTSSWTKTELTRVIHPKP